VHSIFCFLDTDSENWPLQDLLPAARCCRRWWQAAVKEKPRGIKFMSCSGQKLEQLCTSSLRGHVRQLDCSKYMAASLSNLKLIRDRLPHLNDLSVQVYDDALRHPCDVTADVLFSGTAAFLLTSNV
jgi:hypothetical protein